MKYCCERLDELIGGNYGIYPPEKEGEAWSLSIQGAKHWVNSMVVDINACPFCGKELKDFGAKE